MPHFVLMTRLAPGSLHDAQSRRSTGKEWLNKVKAACPDVKWVAHYALLGQYDFALASYNGERFLAGQLHSILSQIDASDELVVVDDASTDRTLEIVASFGDRRIRVLRNDRNAGVLAAFERALGATRNEIVLLSDQDDVWLPGKVSEIMARFEHDPAVLLVLSDAEVIDEAGGVTEPSLMALRGGFRPSFASTLVRNRYLGCTMAFRRRLLESALPIPRDVPMHDMCRTPG